jgi:hypothetical protein
MNPRIPVGYEEVGWWLRNFAISHVKREHPRAEAQVEMDREREGESYGLRLALDGRRQPPPAAAPMEFGYAEVAEGRTRFAWCETLAQRLRAEARRLADETTNRSA